MNQPNLILWDIETVANAKAKDFFAKKKFKAPANYKDPGKIEEYVTAERHKETKKAGLQWWTGQIVCVSLKWIRPGIKPMTIVGPDEREVLCQLFDRLEDEELTPTLIGKNGDTFDRPFVIGRAMVHDLGIPHYLRPYRPIEDINQMFGFSARCDQISKLSDYAFGLGLKDKGGHGSDIQGWFDLATLGDDTYWNRIGEYCGGDVDIIHAMLGRWLKSYRSRKSSGVVTGAPSAGETKPSASEPSEDYIPFGKPNAAPVEQASAPMPFFDEMEF